MAAPSTTFSPKIERTTYNDWPAYRLTNGIVSLFIAPDLGGRAIQLQLGEEEFFFANKRLAGKILPESENNVKAGWANYGGDKVWPAPEGWTCNAEWPSVPYYPLDGSRFTSSVVKESREEVAFRVTSPPDLRTGVQFERTFHVYAGTTRLRVDQVMRNISRRRIRWGIWHVTQNDAADARDPSKPNPDLYLYIPLNPQSHFPGGCTCLYGDPRHPSYEVIEGGRMLRAHYLYRVGKAAADSNAGWIAVANGQKNICLVETFRHFPGEEYPDRASVETWNGGPGVISRGPWDQTLANDPAHNPYIFESEVLSPFAQLDPGEEYSFGFHWAPTRVSNPIRDAVWAGAISQPLGAIVSEGKIALAGVFGVYVAGALEAVFYSAMGEAVAQVELMAVDPRLPVRLDKTISLPASAFRVSVRVVDAEGQDCGDLGNCILPPRPTE